MRLVWLVLGLISCVEVPMATQQTEPVIRASIRVNQREGGIEGMGVLILSSRTPLTFEFPNPAIYVLLRTRHRQVPVRFDKPTKQFSWDYIPATWVERDPGEMSPLEVIAIDEKARESRALVVWDQLNGLSAQVQCNGESKGFGGVSVCQSYQGLVQELVFQERTKITVGRPDCEVEDKTGGVGLRWHYKIPSGLCVMRFISLRDPTKSHRHVARGYQDAAIH